MIYRFKPSDVFQAPDFPIACRVMSHVSLFPHRHDFHELVVILDGTARHVLDDQETMLGAGDVFLVRGKMTHGWSEGRNLKHVDVYFDPLRLRLPLSELRDLPGYHALFHVQPRLRPFNRTHDQLRLSPPDLAKVGVLLTQLQSELSEQQPGYRFIACAHLLKILRFLSLCYTRADHPDARHLLQCGEVLSHVERHIAEPLTVGQLARVAHMSESTLTRMFQRVTGRPPMDHVIRVRIARAQELLQQGMRITEAAFQCGFNDGAYFSRQFRKVAGMTPREFRSRELHRDA